MLRPDCSVELVERFLDDAAALELEQRLRSELDWEQRSIVLFGRSVAQPRLIAWGGDLPYRYSGQTLEPRALPPSLQAVLVDVSNRTGVDWNHVLVNRYRDGQDSMGWHADAEPELGPDPPVATLSLGATRRFLLRPRRPAGVEERRAFELSNGSLLLMAGATQRHYVHCIPRSAGVLAERISLTFRRISREPSARRVS